MANEEQKNNEAQNSQNEQQRKPFDTPAFIKALLDKMGCKCEANPQNQLEFSTTFQGEKFAIRAQVGYPFVRIHDMWWNSVEMDKMEDVFMAREAVNQINGAMPGYSVIYNMSPQEKLMGIHTMAEVLMIDAIPDPIGYLQRILEGFFQQKRNYFQCVEAMKKAQAQENSVKS